jgi:uncharacterized protein DUF4038/collagenase-like protein with putative collagen-binding domain
MRSRISFFILLVALAGISSAQQEWKHGRLQVTNDGHYLQYEDGTRFFWLGDTGWELFHRLKKEEIEKYLENRRQKGFNVIQAVILAEFDGLRKPNQYGEVPLKNLDPTQPNEKYFELIDWTLEQAMKKNMLVGLLPTWGDKVLKLWGQGPEIFTEGNAYIYGKWLGNRYRSFQNIIWIVGGDRPAFNDSTDKRVIWRSMVKGILEGTNQKAIITYHPWGESSSTKYWPDEPWLNIHMLQSGHAKKDNPVWEWIKRDRELLPVKPVIDGEPNYEDHPVNWNSKNGYFRDYDVRRQCYRSVFAGACGVTYGNQAMWQFYSDREEAVAFPERSWIETLDRPGAFQVGHLKKLIESRSVTDRIPDQKIIVDGQGEKIDYITAFKDAKNRYCMVYLPVGKKISIDISFIQATQIRVWWFDPRKGEAGKPSVLRKENLMSFTSPSIGIEKDWVLVIDDANTKFSEPGK